MKGNITTFFLILAGSLAAAHPPSSLPLGSLAKYSKSEIHGRDIGELRI